MAKIQQCHCFFIIYFSLIFSSSRIETMKSWCVHMQIKQVPGVKSQGVLMLSQIADPYVAQVVVQKQLVLLPMLQPPVNTKPYASH